MAVTTLSSGGACTYNRYATRSQCKGPSIAIVSHGDSGELELGSSLITDANLATHSNVLAEIGAALAPGSAGLYQIAIQVPATLADGDWPIQAAIGGVQSPAGILITVQQ